MKKRIILLVLLFNVQNLFTQTPDDHLFFSNLFDTSIKSLENAKAVESKILNSSPGQNQDLSLVISCANYYFIEGTKEDTPEKIRNEYIKKSKDLYEYAWKKDLSNHRIHILLSMAYLNRARDKNISTEEILNYVFRARNFFSIVLNDYPNNLDALLGRIRINMNLTPETGRPDNLYQKDIQIFLEGYEKLPPNIKENQYFLMGNAEVLLAESLLYYEQKKIDLSRDTFEKINSKYLHKIVMEKYKNLKVKLK